MSSRGSVLEGLQRSSAQKGLGRRVPGSEAPQPPVVADDELVAAAEPVAAPRAPRPARQQTAPAPAPVAAEGSRGGPARELCAFDLPGDLHARWTDRLQALGIRWRGDAVGAALAMQLAMADRELGAAVLSEQQLPRQAKVRVGARLRADLHQQWRARLRNVGDLGPSSSVSAAIRAALEMSDDDFRAMVVDHRSR